MVGPETYVFTKCVLTWDDSTRKITPNHSAASIRQECENSLRRLQVEAVDLYQMHWPPADNGPALEQAWRTLVDLKREGKARWVGVSNFDAAQLRRAEAIAPVTSLQPSYSILRRQIDQETLPHCEKRGIGVIVYSPMFSGMLTGGMTRERAASLPSDDHRSRNPEFKEPKLSKNLEGTAKLKEIGARHGRSSGEMAIAWTLRNPAVTGAIVGTRNAKQAEGVLRAGDFRLSAQEIAALSANIAKAKAAS